MYKKVYSATTIGISSQLVTIEVDISYGLLQWHIVGLADAAIKESRQRVAAALKNCGIKIPDRKIIINLAPADLKKEGSSFDLPIAIGILLASDIIKVSPTYLQETLWLGELALDGTVHPIKGVLPIACDALELGKKRIVLPACNQEEALVVEGLEIIPVEKITDLITFLSGQPSPQKVMQSCIVEKIYSEALYNNDFKDVKGQESAKRALQIAASGCHNIMLVGAPGSGKTMLAERLMTIMPELSQSQKIEISKVYSIAGLLKSHNGLISSRPFRSPHHSISTAGLLGGGSIPKPGEISFAHQGILFLDEFLEFKKSVLEQLRQPLEGRLVTISRAQMSATYPASFLLIAAMNPCPCGYYGDLRTKCSCSAYIIEKYLQKLSGPLLDRIDLQVGVQSISYDNLEKGRSTSSQELFDGVKKASLAQEKRFGTQAFSNAHMSSRDVEKYCICTKEAELLLKNVFTNKVLSLRSYHKLLKVSRTIADIEGSDLIQEPHIHEACMYRALDYLLGKCKQVA